ncbi:amidohydrolase [Patescibacteria group bacterium]|nr:amidohydrolase [Patescibacteria group bacterium]MBU2219751.1 amidohydrolase [Patescibacteria group bacterium]MBU2265317.1 amidohydrolase [Patescibacteria group bacterium]
MLFIKNTTIVTQNNERQVIKNGAVLIVGEKIADIGLSVKLEKKYTKIKKKIINGRGWVLIPGLINAHTHAAMSLLRGFADDLPLKDWLEQKIWPAEAKFKPRDIYRGTKLACQEMLRSGTTTFFDMYWQPESIIKAVRETGIRGFVGPLIIDLGTVAVGPKQIEALYSRLKQKLSGKVKLTIAPHATYTVSEDTLRWCQSFAKKEGLLLHIHLSETEGEVKNCLKKHGCRPIEYLAKIGFLGNNVVAAHCCWLSDKEIKILAKYGVSVAHCPTSNLKLVSGIAPLGKLLKAGVNVCLGTDSAASNNSLDIFSEMKIAALIHKWDEKNPAAADAQTILDLATINGVKALKIDRQVGSIDTGKQADIVIVNFNQPHLQPCHSEVSNLVYAARGGDVSAVIINGQVLF